MSDTTVTIIVAVLGSSALASIISGIFSIVASKKKTENGVEAGVLILLYDRIKHLGTEYIRNEKVTYDEYEDLLKMHSVYHNDLKGNGFLDSVMKQVAQLQKYEEERK